MLKELILKNRSYRRFYQEKNVEIETLSQLVDLARLSPSAFNRQALRYILCTSNELNDKIYETLIWAGYYKDWNGPIEGEKPSAFIVMLKDTSVGLSLAQDEGIAAQSILLGATETGLGGCMIGNVNKKKLAEVLGVDDKYEIVLVIAIGYPKETVMLDPMNQAGDVKYWKDVNLVHHVPKRSLDEIILKTN